MYDNPKHRGGRHGDEKTSFDEGGDARLRQVLDTSPVAVSITSVDGKRLWMNRELVKSRRISYEELMRRHSSEVFVDPAVRDELLAELKDHGHTGEREVEMQRPDGTRHWTLFSLSKIEYEGQPAKVSWAYDISDRKQAEEMVASQRDELEALNEEKNRFFSIIAHDLRSPFTTLLGMTRLMSQRADSFSKEELSEYATTVNEVANQTHYLLHNLLEWSRMQMEGAEPDPRANNLRDLADKSIVFLDQMAAKKNITLVNRMKNTGIFADPDIIQTVIRNLTSNALKFTPTGGRVELTSRKKGQQVEVRVSDNGIGIPPQQMDNLFNIHRKTSSIGTDGEKGTGLGLLVCRDLLQRSGTELEIKSSAGEGTLVSFRLPVAETS